MYVYCVSMWECAFECRCWGGQKRALDPPGAVITNDSLWVHLKRYLECNSPSVKSAHVPNCWAISPASMCLFMWPRHQNRLNHLLLSTFCSYYLCILQEDARSQLGMRTHACKPNTWKTEAGDSEVQGQGWPGLEELLFQKSKINNKTVQDFCRVLIVPLPALPVTIPRNNLSSF